MYRYNCNDGELATISRVKDIESKIHYKMYEHMKILLSILRYLFK
jgi:hypothetical protein